MGQQVRNDLNNLIRLTKADMKGAAEVLARAFHDYPLSVYFEQNEDKRRKTSPRIYRSMINHGLKYGEVYATSPRYEGVAVWFSEKSRHDAWWTNIISGRFFVPLIVGIRSTKRQMAFGKYAMAARKRAAPFPHWYLQMLGVDPQYQGQGFSSKLLKPIFARIDKEELPCFLETQAEKNVALYEHFGFKVIEEGIVPGTGITSWAMLRDKAN
ncbi:MAG: GNAT family N-acetyltransferase [Dehalococcoidales bacterium]|nr:GNAT family N-acetyltransferase [Dehalococcoidales bacterium]